MDKAELLDHIAPCSLNCRTCAGYAQGEICLSARRLSRYLEGMGEFYEKHRPEKVEEFQTFARLLAEYADAPCGGCRDRAHRGCSIEGCFLLECTREHGVDFCGECAAFPCERTRAIFEDEVYAQWLRGGTQIKEWGIDEFYRQNGDRPHYRAYQKGEIDP